MRWLQFAIDVLSLGSAYALMALGLVIVYGILRLVNFAYGELIMVAGYTMYLVSRLGAALARHGGLRGADGGGRRHRHRLRRLPAGAEQDDHGGADHLLRLLDAVAERGAALHLAAPAPRAAAGDLLAHRRDRRRGDAGRAT